MPLREDLLEPIAGDAPAGQNLYYDKVFDQIKEARIEDDDSIPAGEWGRAPKKADRVLVIKVAGEALAKRSKDLRLAGWYLESLIRKEGFGQLAPGLEFLWQMQDQFWDGFHPEKDDDGDLGLRIGAIEGAAALLATQMKLISLTRSGINWLEYQDARALGFEADERSADKAEARADAVSRGRLTGDDLQKTVDGTPKAFYLETDAALARSLGLLDDLDRFHEEKYGDDFPSLNKLKNAIEDVKKVVGSVLAEKRKTDPDAVGAGEEVEEAPAEEVDSFAQYDDAPAPVAEVSRPAAAAPRRVVPAGAPADLPGAYAQVAAAAEFLHAQDGASAVPYLLCSALRLGETRSADLSDMGFAVAPPTETRQMLRRLANEANWDDLMRLCLRTLVEPCGRVWLDLQRYVWRGASETGNSAVAAAVVSTVRGLLIDLPQVRTLTLDDDTPAANAETLQWLDAEVMPPVVEVSEETAALAALPEPVYVAVPVAAGSHGDAPDIYEMALQVLKRGKTGEAITMLARDSELQPSGRMRFLRRVQMAQLCLTADQGAVAYPVLLDLCNEMERRGLETWEASEMLAQPLSLLLRCVDQRKGNAEDREALFARLCRLDPQAALTVRR